MSQALRRSLCLALAALLLCGGLALSRPAAAAKKQDPQAGRLFHQGRDEYRKRRYPEAEAAFAKAYAIDPAPVFLYNIARCREKQGNYLGAIESYQQFLEADEAAPNRADVEATLRYLEEKVAATQGRLELRSEPPGAAVYLDGRAQPAGRSPLRRWLPPGEHGLRAVLAGHLGREEVFTLRAGQVLELELSLLPEDAPGKVSIAGAPEGSKLSVDGAPAGETPLAAPLALAPGAHELRLDKDGHLPFVAALQVTAGADLSVTATMPALPAAAPPLPPPPEAPEGSALGTAAWVSGGVAALALGTGAVLWFLASDSAQQAKDLSSQPGRRTEWETLDDEAQRRVNLANAALLGAGVAAVAAGTLFTLDWLGDSSAAADSSLEGEPPATPRSWQLVPSGRGLGFALAGSF